MSTPIIEEATVTQINTNPTKSSKRKKKTLRHSNFLLTINTQKRPTTNEEAQQIADQLNNVMDTFLTSPKHRNNLFTIRPGGEDTVDGLPPKIHKLEIEYAVEVGKELKGGRVHSHTVIKTIHNTQIHVNTDYVRKTMPGLLGVGNVFVHCRFIRTDHSVEEYIRKDEYDSDEEELNNI
ncbi:hypothetical protein ACTFIY_004586 [Dictyostelium cf. discoideum]